eukprot:PLAT7163.1.p3 GENE.PLAT7163.1~~PLAT7163.1.p3  ORF type:complete len:129 (-),score=1.51 PLAT7163.1:433-819(-)
MQSKHTQMRRKGNSAREREHMRRPHIAAMQQATAEQAASALPCRHCHPSPPPLLVRAPLRRLAVAHSCCGVAKRQTGRPDIPATAHDDTLERNAAPTADSTQSRSGAGKRGSEEGASGTSGRAGSAQA